MKNLSIVFQGPANPQTGTLFKYVRRTRNIWPEAEIIVSTWHSSQEADQELSAQLDPLGARLVLSHDPGPVSGTDASGIWYSNLNRLLCSSHAGLAVASRPLAIKLRTDTWLSNRSLHALLEQVVSPNPEPQRSFDYKVFHSRVITATWFARDARGSQPWLFHPGDILLAGRTEDLRLFFSAPQAAADLFQPATMPGLWSAWRYVPEQWFWVHAIRQRTGRDVFAGNFHHSPQLVADSERYFLANFVPFSPRRLGLHWPKYWLRYPFRGLFSVYTHSRWKRLAQRCEGATVYSPKAAVSWFFTQIWRMGYCLRLFMLRQPRLRALARKLFSHHR